MARPKGDTHGVHIWTDDGRKAYAWIGLGGQVYWVEDGDVSLAEAQELVNRLRGRARRRKARVSRRRGSLGLE